jgi:hypothetical protein
MIGAAGGGGPWPAFGTRLPHVHVSRPGERVSSLGSTALAARGRLAVVVVDIVIRSQ